MISIVDLRFVRDVVVGTVNGQPHVELKGTDVLGGHPQYRCRRDQNLLHRGQLANLEQSTILIREQAVTFIQASRGTGFLRIRGPKP